MATVLLIIQYIAFIGLGTPDSLFGTAWPVMYKEFALPISYAGIASVIGSGCTVISSLMSSRLIKRFGTGRIVAISTGMTALALLGYSLAPSFAFICLFAIPLGLGAGSIDTALNSYVALHYPAAHMSYLHCFYGIGITISPYLMSLVINGSRSWRGGYEIVFYIQVAIALVCIAALPVWKRARGSLTQGDDDESNQRIVGIRQLAKMPDARGMWAILLASMGIECSCSAWAATFLVDHKLMAASSAAEIMVVYFLGMTLGRFLSGILSRRFAGWRMIFMGISVMAAAVILMLLPLGAAASAAALFLIGLGNGPIYPNITHLTPITFGRDISRSVVGSQMSFANLGAMLLPPFFGIIARRFGLATLPWYLLILFAVLLICSLRCSGRRHSAE